MSTFDSDDLEATGYFLPEDSRLRLKKLREYIGFLSRLAQPRRADEEQEHLSGIRVGEAAICLEWLAEQLGLVLDDISRAADRHGRKAAPGAGAEPETAEVPGGAGGRYLFGVTLDQIDAMNLRIEMIMAHGDVVIASDDAEFADHTLSVLGHAIFCDAEELRGIINDVGLQNLGPACGPQTGVGEERGTYLAAPARLPVDSGPHSAWPLRAYRQRGKKTRDQLALPSGFEFRFGLPRFPVVPVSAT
ncbi:MAG: XAC0095 family protein [Rhodanobacter sp.]